MRRVEERWGGRLMKREDREVRKGRREGEANSQMRKTVNENREYEREKTGRQ